MEESATDLRTLLFYSFQENTVKLHGVRLLGSGETNAPALKSLLRVSPIIKVKLWIVLMDMMHHSRVKDMRECCTMP